MVVRLTGGIGIEVDGAAAGSVIGRLGQLAFAYLVCERHRPVTRDELAELLWGDEVPRSSGQLVRGIVAKVRAALAAAGLDPATTLVTTSGAWQVHLPADATIDIEDAAAAVEGAMTAEVGEAFALASAAVAIASRQFLPGVSGAWAERRQAELRELHLRALEVLAESAVGRGQWAAAASAAEAAIGIEPFRESAYLPLMAAHAGAGNRGEALRAYERCRRTLADELGVNPSAATEAAYLQLLGDEPVDRPAPDETSSPRPPRVPLALAASPASFLVGRAPELSRLLDAFDRATTGSRQAVLISGEPGIGKTALVSGLATQVNALGAHVLYGRCDEDLAVSYQPFAEVLGQLVASRPRGLAAALDAFGGDLLRLAPELARQLPGVETAAGTDPDADRFAMFRAVTAVVSAASTSAPVVLVVDDLHWATHATLLLLRHLVRSPDPAAVLIVGTYRSSEVGPAHPLTAILSDLRRIPTAQRIELEGLSEVGVGEFVEAASGQWSNGGQAGLAEAIHAHTAGNPFFVGELLRHLSETGAVYRKVGRWSYYAADDGLGVPAGVREVVARRLAHLSGATNRCLVWAAVIGARFDLDAVEAVDAGSGDDVLSAMEESLAARLVVEIGPGQYAFAHTLVRDTIYMGLTATRVGRLHHLVGEAIEGLPGEIAPRLPALAHHFISAASAVDAATAADYALAAARRAFTQAAWEDAIAILDRGVAAIERYRPDDLERHCDLLLALTEAWVRLWDPRQAVTASLRAAESARALGSAERLGRAASWYYGNIASAGGAGTTEIGSALAEEALADLGEDMPALRALILARLAYARAAAGAGGFDTDSRAALALARLSGDPEALGVALYVRCRALAAQGANDEHLAVAEELVSAAPAGGWDGWRSGYVERAGARLRAGDRAGFDADTDEVERLGTEGRFWGISMNATVWRATQALLDGRFAEVEALASQAAAAARIPMGDVYAIQMFRLHFDQGRLEACAADLGRSVADHPGNSALSAMLALIHAELGAADDARRRFDGLSADGFAGLPQQLRAVTLAYLAEVAALLGDEQRAALVYEYLLPFSGQVVAAGAIAHCPGAVDRYLGQLAATLRRHSEAERHYVAALALEAGLKSPPLVARTRHWYARMLLDRGGPHDRDRAAELLAESLAAAVRLDMVVLARQGQDLMARV